MKIGVLLCDRVNPALRPEFGDYPEMFTALLNDLSDTPELAFYASYNGELPLSAIECDAYVISGSKHSVNDKFEWIAQLQSFILILYQKQIPLVGICFGHQLIAKALGGKVALSEKDWGLGVTKLNVFEPQGWMHSNQSQLNLLVSHQEQVITLPKGAKILAGNDFCPVGIFQIGRHFLGIQGHPEFTPEYTAALIQLRAGQISNQTLDLALASLRLDVNRELVLNWIAQFLRPAPQTQ